MLDEVERICKANGLKYFADSGTLIGAIRHEGYIPWDDDIDLVMLREDYDKFVQIAPDWLKEDLVLQTVYTEKNYLSGHAQIRNSKTCGCNEEDKKAGYNCGIFIDIFPLDGMPKTEKERKSWAKRSSFIGPYFIPGTALIIMKMQRFLEKLLHGIGMLLHVPMVKAYKGYEKLCTRFKGKDTEYVCDTVFIRYLEKKHLETGVVQRSCLHAL